MLLIRLVRVTGAAILALGSPLRPAPLGDVLIPPTSHSAGNRPNASWRLLFDEANRTMSSANSRDGIRRPPNLTPSAAWLCLEIFPLKTMNRTGDKGQLWWRLTLTGNKSDFLPAMQTKLWLWQYRDRMAHNKRPSTPYSWNTPYKTPWGTWSKLMLTGLANANASSSILVRE